MKRHKPARETRAIREVIPVVAVKTVRLGISACLLGDEVRHDGGHKRDAFLVDTFGPFVEWVSICPEEEAGFGTPRESMRLVRSGERVRLLTVRTERDVTEQLRSYLRARVAKLGSADLDGYVLKKDSPSCGLFRVKVYGGAGPAVRSGRGLFAEALCSAFPFLPMEEEGRLSDPGLRENFVERVFAYRRLRALLSARMRVGELVAFHTRHKLQLLAHSPKRYAELGRLVARARPMNLTELAAEYGRLFMEALAVMTTRGRHANALQHMAGYFDDLVDAGSRRELASTIADYQRGLLPLIVPMTLIAHYAKCHRVAYLLDQIYLQPHPKELMLRNHV